MSNSSEPAPVDVLALDFDGVLCDTVVETAISAWRAGRALWPQWWTAEPPPRVLERFIRLRPVLETGYQAIGLMRLADSVLDPVHVLTDFHVLLDGVYAPLGKTPDQLVELFSRTRDAWIRDAPDDWLSRHRFFPGAAEALRRALARLPVFVISTKQERFIQRLLEAEHICVPRNRIFGLDRGCSKEQVLRQLRARREYAQATFHFVEDRLQTLQRMAAADDLAESRLYLAAWGYNTAAEKEVARQSGRIHLLTKPDLSELPLRAQ